MLFTKIPEGSEGSGSVKGGLKTNRDVKQGQMCLYDAQISLQTTGYKSRNQRCPAENLQEH